MIRIQDTLKVCFLFILLFIVAMVPTGITYMNNQKLVNKVHTVNISEEEQIVFNALKTKEKLATIIRSNEKENGVLIRQEKIYLEKNNQTELINTLEKQLILLQEKNIIPNIDFLDKAKVDNISKITCLDADMPQNIVRIKEFFIENENYRIWGWLDMDTSVLYQITIDAKNDLPEFQKKLNPSAYLEYLGLPVENIGYQNDTYGGWIFFDSEDTHILYRYERNNQYIEYLISLKF